MDFAHMFLKKLQFFFFVFLNKDYNFYTINLFIRPKNCVQSILYNERFLSLTRQNFEDNLRILANFGKFSRKNSKFYGSRKYVFKKLVFFFHYNKDYSFYTKNLFIRPKNCVQIIFLQRKMQKFRKNQFFSNILTFLSVIRQKF